jgi:hypothetical protein
MNLTINKNMDKIYILYGLLAIAMVLLGVLFKISEDVERKHSKK